MNDVAARSNNTITKRSSHGATVRAPIRSHLDSLNGHDDPGFFGKMFPTLYPFVASDAALRELADAMKDAAPGSAAGDNTHIPAGFTYLGQFVDHDITLDITSLAEQREDPMATRNFRTPRLDLDAVYGMGPAVNPHLFKRGAGPRFALTPRLLLGKTQTGGADPSIPADLPNDLPRSPEGQALIGDPRNDENLLVAQLHLAFLKFHNKVVDMLEASASPPSSEELFEAAREIVVWHYQWLVLHDFVERLTEPGIVAKILHEGRRYYRFRTTPYMPVEFSGAAYRLGHAMVREDYSHNRVFRPGGIPATLQLLFGFTGKSGGIIGDLAPNPPTGPLPVRVLPSDWIIDWRRFFDFGTAPQPNFEFNHSRKLDPFVVPALHTLPGETGDFAVLPFRNLRRGVVLGLPSGQDVARHMRITPLTRAELSSGPDGAIAAKHGFDEQAPLWYYILKEAQVKKGGVALGPVGARIVAEVFVGLVQGDHESYLWKRRNWKPTLPAKTPGTFTMVDLLQFVGDIDPIDGITTV